MFCDSQVLKKRHKSRGGKRAISLVLRNLSQLNEPILQEVWVKIKLHLGEASLFYHQEKFARSYAAQNKPWMLFLAAARVRNLHAGHARGRQIITSSLKTTMATHPL